MTVGDSLLAAGALHDFRNHLQVIAARVTLAQRRLAAGRYDDAADHLAAASTDMTALIRQMGLSLAGHRAETGPIDPGTVLRAMEPAIRAVLGEGATLQATYEAGPCAVLCEAAQFEAAVMNLVLNARDAMLGQGVLAVHVRRAGASLEMVFTDTGEGMEEAVRVRVFDAYFSTKPKGGGTGLGLFQISTLMTRLGGSIDVESRKGAGTSMILRLPCLER